MHDFRKLKPGMIITSASYIAALRNKGSKHEVLAVLDDGERVKYCALNGTTQTSSTPDTWKLPTTSRNLPAWF